MVKCSGKKCKEKKHIETRSGGVPPKGEHGPPPPPPEKKVLVPFPDLQVSADDISTFDIDSVDSSALLSEGDDIQSCEKRMWLANVCTAVVNSSSADDAFSESIGKVKGKKGYEKTKKDMDKQYKKYQKKCNEISAKSAKSKKSFQDVKPCGDITVPKNLDAKTIAEKCLQVLNATNPHEAFPELNHTANSTFAQNLLADGFGLWLAKCRGIHDTLAKTGESFDSYTSSNSSVGKGHRGKRSIDVSNFANDAVETRAYRKEIRALTDDERKRYFDAINRLKSDTVAGISKYDSLVMFHSEKDSPGAHWGPAFLPFHREFLKQ